MKKAFYRKIADDLHTNADVRKQHVFIKFGDLLDDGFNKFRVAALCPANPSRWTLIQEG